MPRRYDAGRGGRGAGPVRLPVRTRQAEIVKYMKERDEQCIAHLLFPTTKMAHGHIVAHIDDDATHPDEKMVHEMSDHLGYAGPSIAWTLDRMRVCCLCDVSDPGVNQCTDVADCAVDRMQCFAFADPTLSLACRSVLCIPNQLQCLRERLTTANGACRQHLLDAISHWEEMLEEQRRICEGKN